MSKGAFAIGLEAKVNVNDGAHISYTIGVFADKSIHIEGIIES